MHLVEESKGRELWRIAKRRSSFQKHLRTYIIMSVFFWVIWYFTSGDYYGGLPWPAGLCWDGVSACCSVILKSIMVT